MDTRRRCRIALVEHDPAVARAIVAALRGAGHACRRYASGAMALREIDGDRFDCILIERGLPDIAAHELIAGVRSRLGYALPVIGLAHDTDIVAALDEGVDDCLSHPVAPRLLLAQIDAAMRRLPPRGGRLVAAVGHLAFSPEGYRVQVAGVTVQLTAKEYALALLLCRRLGEILAREEILHAVWGTDVAPATRTLDVHVSRLRTKLDLTPERGFRLSAIYGRGYRLEMIASPPRRVSPRRSASPSAPGAAAPRPAAR
jgi:DNA-binding response OmpR family regulator